MAAGDTAGYQQGNVAHDAVDSGFPLKVGARARANDVAAVTEDDRTDNLSDLLGKQVILPGALPGHLVDGLSANMTGTADTPVIAAQGAGVRIYVTALVIINEHATVDTAVVIKDGATAKLRVFTKAGAASVPVVVPLPSPLRLTANTALNAANITTGSSTYVSAVGYKAAN